LSVLAGGKRYAPVRKAPPPPPEPEILPPVEVDFALLPRIREQARELTEILIVEDTEPAGVAFLPPGQVSGLYPGGKNAAPAGLIASLSPDQIAIVEFLCEGNGVPPPFDEIMIEAINEAALDTFGDTLIEMDEDGFRVIEEYRDSWKEL